MFNFFHSIIGKIAVGISSILIGVTGFVSPVPKTTPPISTTTTVEAKTSETTAGKPTPSFVPIIKISKDTSSKSEQTTTPTPVKNLQSVSEWKATQPPTPPSIFSTNGDVVVLPQSTTRPAQQPQGNSCIGKMWNDCPSGKIFYCTATGGNCRNESDLLCNGKYWINDCPSGTTFYCPTTGGDVSCQKNQTQTQNVSPTSNQSSGVDPMISLLDAEFKKQQAKNDEILRQMNIITAKYEPQIKILNEQLQSLSHQFGDLNTACGIAGCVGGEKLLQSNQILLDQLKISSQITNLQSEETAELNKIPGYSSIHVSPNTTSVPLYSPSVSSITVMSPRGATTLQITSYQSGTYFVADTSTGKSYMISGGSGNYSVSPF